jgi:hypothetical protein
VPASLLKTSSAGYADSFGNDFILRAACSVGTAEDYRPDYKDFAPEDMGLTLPAWPQER